MGIALTALLPACSRSPSEASDKGQPSSRTSEVRAPVVTIGEDQEVPVWRAPDVEVDAENIAAIKQQAAEALATGELFGSDDDAIPLYLALQENAPADEEVSTGLDHALVALLARGDGVLSDVDADPGQLRGAHEIAAVARTVAPADPRVGAYLGRLDIVDQAQQASLRGERALNDGQIGEDGQPGGAIGYFTQALSLRPDDSRATQGLAAAESGLIRRAELAVEQDDYSQAEAWLAKAAAVRPHMDTVEQARTRIAGLRAARLSSLRDEGIAALAQEGGLDAARESLATLLRIAPAGAPAAIELRERIELASHYGLFRPGQAFTDALRHGGRGPELVVIPHGAFRMGADAGEAGSSDAERPTRSIRFDRGLAVARHEITVAEFRRFVTATAYQTRADRRGYSTVYDERSGNLVRRNGVDWRSDYAGAPAGDHLPVIHVSAKDAQAYAQWLSDQTGQRYRLPSEAEFEYSLRAGNPGPFPWGKGAPPEDAGNFTGARDTSPSGRHWRNAFADYGDGAWGPARVGSYVANAYGLHDLAGNVSEWVADCWHSNYRRAPSDGKAWINPGCQQRVVRGGSWASSPEQTRSAWRLGSDVDTTNARVGFRVVREI
ncbi:MAG: formylglycine-generating enzyme family protein [Lysobacter sp.]